MPDNATPISISDTLFDAVVVGGSTAGLNAALLLGRSMRRTLVIDAGKPCNRTAPHAHNLLTRDGIPPDQLLSLAREQALHYPTISLLTDTVLTAETGPTGFVLTTAGGHRLQTRKLLLATGVQDELLPIPGFAECWGRSVLHCPYCHGYEVRTDRLGVLANGPIAADMVPLIHHWSQRLTLFTNGPATLTQPQRQLIDRLEVPLIETPVAALAHQYGYLSAMHLTDGTSHPLDALFSRVPFRQSGNLAEQLGCALTETGLVQTDAYGHSTVPGVWVAGDASSPMRSLSAAAAAGAAAAAFLNRALISDDLPVS